MAVGNEGEPRGTPQEQIEVAKKIAEVHLGMRGYSGDQLAKVRGVTAGLVDAIEPQARPIIGYLVTARGFAFRGFSPDFSETLEGLRAEAEQVIRSLGVDPSDISRTPRISVKRVIDAVSSGDLFLPSIMPRPSANVFPPVR